MAVMTLNSAKESPKNRQIDEISPMSASTDKRSTDKIPLVAFEHYMLADDRPSHPMTCHIRFWFRGRFEKDLFRKAVREVLPRHPIFQMRVEGSSKNKTKSIFWTPCETMVMPFISWADSQTPLDEPPGGFAQNIYKDIGLRFWIRDSAENSATQTMILVQFHHSICDGIGLFQFMEDLLIQYGTLAGHSMPTMREIDPSVFPFRGDFSLKQDEWRKRRSLDLKRTGTFFRSLAQPLKVPKLPPEQLTKVADLHASVRQVLPESVLEKLRVDARDGNASVNDLLIRGLFTILSNWNAMHGAKNPWIRIAIPTSLRGPVEEKMSAANVVSMIFLSRKREEILKPELLPTIVAEMKDIKDKRLGVALPRVIRRLGRYRRAVYSFLHLPACSSTAVLTNLGRPFSDSPLAGTDGKVRVGDITLESLETMPPVRPRTSVSISVNYYGKLLSVTLRYDSTVLTPSCALDILNRYCDQLKKGCM